MEVARGALPDLVNGLYDYLMIDLASITYGLMDPRAFLVNVRLAIDYDYLRPSVVFVVDYSRPGHRAVAKSRIKRPRDLGLDYILADYEPTEIKVARECLRRGRCIVLSRDCNPTTIKLFISLFEYGLDTRYLFSKSRIFFRLLRWNM